MTRDLEYPLRPPELIRVALVEPKALIREALTLLLNEAAGIRVITEAPNVGDILSIIRSEHPDVVLISIDAGGEPPFAALQELRETAPFGHALILTGADDPGLYLQAIEFGAMGVVMKEQSSDLLIKAIRKVHAGEIWLDRTRTAGLVNRLSKGRDDPESMKVASLTAREREIVALVAEGLNNKRIADRLFISEATARNHLTSILSKLELSDRFQLAVYAYRRGLVLFPRTTEMVRMAAVMRSDPGHRSRQDDLNLARRRS